MNFPLENPVIQFFYWLMNTPGIGSVALMSIVGVLLLIFFSTLWWINHGAQMTESATYAYPTSALHVHHQEGEK